MALMFSRLAHNFIKNGYFPTDERTLSCVLSAIAFNGQRARIYDPCAGEGTALAEIQRHLAEGGSEVEAIAVEYDSERARHAKAMLDVAIHSDNADVFVTRRSCGLLYLNPPYGQSVSDSVDKSHGGKGERLEVGHLKRAYDCLQIGGVLVYVIPSYALDESLATFLARHFSGVKAYLAPEQRFRQCVIFGVRRRVGHPSIKVVEDLLGLQDDVGRVLTEASCPQRYEVPEMAKLDDFVFRAIRIDPDQLWDELQRFRNLTLWPQFDTSFSRVEQHHRHPLRALSRWHLALALAAGQITGAVRSNDGRVLYIKGDTFKEKTRRVETQTNDEGESSQTITLTDRFVPIIRGIDLTPGEKLGSIVTIR